MNEEVSFISEIKTFEHEKFGQIRFVDVIFKDVKRENETWFAAVDLCRVLGLTNPTMALENFDDDEKMTLSITEGHSGKRGGAQFMNFVSEPGMYRLIFMSRKPEAKKFQRWVFHEVLPSIRKYGYYIAPHQIIRSVEGRKNFDALKAKYPKGAVELKQIKFEYEDDGCGGEISHKIYKFVLHSNDN